MNLKDLVKDNFVEFDNYKNDNFYYTISWIIKPINEPEEIPYGTVFIFPIPICETVSATLLKKDKAITFMRWIRKAITDGTFINTGIIV